MLPGLRVPHTPWAYEIGANAAMFDSEALRKVGTNATSSPRLSNSLSTERHQSTDLASALKAETTGRPSGRRYADGFETSWATLAETIDARGAELASTPS